MDELCNKWLRAVAEMDAGLMVGKVLRVQSATYNLQQTTISNFVAFSKVTNKA